MSNESSIIEVVDKVKNLDFWNGHSILSPSGIYLWGHCSGAMIDWLKDRKEAKDNIASIEGTVGHALLEYCSSRWIHPTELEGKPLHLTYEARLAHETDLKRILDNPNNTMEVKEYAKGIYEVLLVSGAFTEEMIVYIGECYDALLSAYRRLVEYDTSSQFGTLYWSELHVRLDAFFGHDQCNGTSDCVLWNGKKLIIADLKYGVAVPVYAERNKQLMMYALGAILFIWETYGYIVEEVELVIMQPRINNRFWETWQTSRYEIENELRKYVPISHDCLRVLSGFKQISDDSFHPSSRTCEYCHRSAVCAPRREFVLESMTKAMGTFDEYSVTGKLDVPPYVFDMPSHQLKQAVDIEPLVMGWFNDMKKEAHERTKKGDLSLGLKLVKGRLRRKIKGKTDSEKLKNLIKCGVPIKDAFTYKPKSPKQLESSLLDTKVKEKVKSITIVGYGDPVVALETDMRERFNPFASVDKK